MTARRIPHACWVGAAALLGVTVARAQAWPPPPATPDDGRLPYAPNGLPPGPTVSPPLEPTAEELRSRRNHDGFQLRMTAGATFLYDRVTNRRNQSSLADGTVTLSGPGFGTELSLGGNVSSELALGGTLGYARTDAPTQGGAARPPITIDQGVLGAYLDWYPDPHRGHRLQLLAGWTILSVTPHNDARTQWTSTETTGYVIAPAAGHEWWISDQWSFGVQARLSFSRTSTSDAGTRSTPAQTHQVVTPSLQASFVYH